ncbi:MULTISPECIES: orotate phosphoribosyltransferase [Helicobacter]|uniref:Orotate phosphoribosyltransferase n=1 Tax=Helicobacter typhlonius TaxID=76936 RepID=A0A099UB49_9HELI|nr:MULTISPECIES: orotate phosphoribosyltransferase [Helicobacter]TLD78715.1 orotate phosphoribosyltransferase [Helicobacter typhlonius]TLD89503.1 orotate phosphoribosyltransferase [Helicobacter sp. MIT 03-1616]CUU39999.1 Orotate phosphoribosyltransferase [Helicobacter typhlonius]
MLDVKQCYINANALLKGHFLLSSGNHSDHYLQSARVLENPIVAERLATALATQVKDSKIKVDCVCSPAIGGLLAGYELARALGVRFIFTERVEGQMQLRRGFEVSQGEKILICEDIITTGGSALESAQCVEFEGAEVVAYAGLANRGFCKRVGSSLERKKEARLPEHIPLFALEDFVFNMYEPHSCPLCASGEQKATKPGSRGN